MSHQYSAADSNWARQAFQGQKHSVKPQDLEWGPNPPEQHQGTARDSGQLLVPRSLKPKPWQSKLCFQSSQVSALHVASTISIALYQGLPDLAASLSHAQSSSLDVFLLTASFTQKNPFQ